ncbi:hypothetical protein GUITHDRAFT_150983 [Guillardia theta CCMP2712]|uniref:Uncharacterized protein n=1 Tax=Guillardia theta (strain CCMP2712) TaxID=905079 RepID=L1JR79_GUITC|nr:hypothetical protein GUITHDRAFT_150983 [Guillardia theta CCMP2712]EKX51076.1 hypothetical protein GUITHDRAFT_150983 [Guillardia theta CCMP2712]|mmetsp:Transcript_21022/g.47662  ORF Transcript_21022/g.47662 Transcript_21022/m.47662 type:complete len:88 (+) Transcript_21022:2-265(+)|eukprot:XP_005838056.1 hypothetical protein GUITHDRAFT_150983 [Guillardia theta CCMP2712]
MEIAHIVEHEDFHRQKDETIFASEDEDTFKDTKVVIHNIVVPEQVRKMLKVIIDVKEDDLDFMDMAMNTDTDIFEPEECKRYTRVLP